MLPSFPSTPQSSPTVVPVAAKQAATGPLNPDIWVRIGSLIAIGIGLADLWYFTKIGSTGQIALITSGLSILTGHSLILSNG